MKLEVGKYYRARNGEKVGPLVVYEDSKLFTEPSKSMLFYCHNGVRWSGDRAWDLISEWEDEMKITMDGKYAYRKDPYTQVRILCVDRPCGVHPVVVMDDDGTFSFHTANGSSYASIFSRDLVPLQEKLPEVWVNVYPNGDLFAHPSYGKAVNGAKGSKEEVKTIKYIPAPDQTS